MRFAAKRFKYGERLLKPATDGAIGEISAGLAVAGVIEARHRPAIRLRPSIECLGLGTFHVGLETAEPEQARGRSVATAHSDLSGRNTGSNAQEFRANIAHRRRLTFGARLHWASVLFGRVLPLNTSMPERQTSRRRPRNELRERRHAGSPHLGWRDDPADRPGFAR